MQGLDSLEITLGVSNSALTLLKIISHKLANILAASAYS